MTPTDRETPGKGLESKQELESRFRPFAEKMEAHGLPSTVIRTFKYYYGRLLRGETGLLSRDDIGPLFEGEIADLEALTRLRDAGRQAATKTVVIKLNGGLGTSMGLSGAKALIQAKSGLSFLDIIAGQILAYRHRHGVPLPLIFMNSFNTEADTLNALSRYPDLAVEGIPLSFLQHKFPKVSKSDLSQAVWEDDPEMEWNPPGHGDIYRALGTSGMLERLLDAGITYAFVSNSDNLGAVMDEYVLGHFANHDLPFMMEVTERTAEDRKGGHLARLANGLLALRESAQCPTEELNQFQDIHFYRYFNTNNIWLNLQAVKALLQRYENVLPLPMIRNPKPLDPRDKSSPEVYQLETAMGSAISLFEGSTALRVPRKRFAPVKQCSDLLAIWSDCYILTEDHHVVLNPKRVLAPPTVMLDPTYYWRIDQLTSRFPYGAPSLLDCESLRIEGDVTFEGNVVIKGNVHILNRNSAPARIPSGTVIDKELVLDT